MTRLSRTWSATCQLGPRCAGMSSMRSRDICMELGHDASLHVRWLTWRRSSRLQSRTAKSNDLRAKLRWQPDWTPRQSARSSRATLCRHAVNSTTQYGLGYSLAHVSELKVKVPLAVVERTHMKVAPSHVVVVERALRELFDITISMQSFVGILTRCKMKWKSESWK